MKILFVIHSLETAGGAEKVMTLLANHISLKKNYNVSILSMSSKDPFFKLNDSITLHKIEINKLGSSGIWSTLSIITKQIRSIRKVITDNDYDVVISFISAMNILAIMAAKLSLKPIIIAERSSFHFGLKNKFWMNLRRITYPFANALVILSDEDRLNYYFVKNKYKIHNPLVIEDKYQNIKREKIILSVGRLHHVKGFDLLIKAFSKIKYNDWKLLIIGEGEERTHLEALIQKLNLVDRVILHGITDDVEKFYKKASIYVLSSRSEGFPNVLCEAMAYGCPVISFNCKTGPSEIIESNKNGILVPPEDISALGREINSLIDNKKKREELAQSAKLIRSELDIDKVTRKWLDVISSVSRKNYKKDINAR